MKLHTLVQNGLNIEGIDLSLYTEKEKLDGVSAAIRFERYYAFARIVSSMEDPNTCSDIVQNSDLPISRKIYCLEYIRDCLVFMCYNVVRAEQWRQYI